MTMASPCQAAGSGDINTVRGLLETEACDVSQRQDGLTPIHYAALLGQRNEAALLIQQGADPCSTDKDGNTPLHYAAGGGHSDVVALLIWRGADPCTTNKDGKTPLCYACVYGHSEVAALLIQRGADPSSTDKNGTRPSGFLLRTNQELETLLRKFENEEVQHFILILCLEHVASTMTLVEANALFKEDMSCNFPNEHENKKLDRLKNWAIRYGMRNIRVFEAKLADAGRQNLAVAAANYYAEIVKEIMDMSADCYETFCQDPWAHRHMISSAGCSKEQSMETDSYQYDAFLAHVSADEKVVEEVRGQLESNEVFCCESPRVGSIKIKSMCESLEMARRTVFFFSQTSLSDDEFLYIFYVAVSEINKRKEDVVIPVTMDVSPESLPPPARVLNCIPLQSQDFIPALVDAIKGPTSASLCDQLREIIKNMRRKIAAMEEEKRELRQQLEESETLSRCLYAELSRLAAATPK